MGAAMTDPKQELNMEKSRTYYFIDINLITKQIENYGESNTATHHGDTGDPSVHRMFVPRGQFNKLTKKLDAFHA